MSIVSTDVWATPELRRGNMDDINMALIWLAALAIFLIAEGVTTSLVSMWFALGSLGALLIALIAEDLVITQIIAFIVISIVTLFFTRPIAQKYLNSRTKRTNADRVLDMTGKVRDAIDNDQNSGSVYIGGKMWTARSLDGEFIPENSLVDVIRIEGVKLIVTKQAESSRKQGDVTVNLDEKGENYHAI